ncbi:MAG: hypothetical protein V1879_04050, partial [Pseudomonadota bacterium]
AVAWPTRRIVARQVATHIWRIVEPPGLIKHGLTPDGPFVPNSYSRDPMIRTFINIDKSVASTS